MLHKYDPPRNQSRLVALAAVASLVLAAMGCGSTGTKTTKLAAFISTSRVTTLRVSRAVPPPHVTKKAVGPGPNELAAAFGSIWISNHSGKSVSRIDPKALRVTAQIPVGVQPGDIAIGLGALWETNYDGTISRIDPRTNRATSVGHFAHLCGQPAIAGAALWVYVCSAVGPYVARVDLKTGKATAKIPAGAYLTSLVLADGELWMSTSSPGKLLRIDARTGKVLQSMAAPGCPGLTRTAFGYGSLWVGQWGACPSGDIDVVLRMDPRTGRVLDTIHTGEQAPIATVGDGAVWAGGGDDGKIKRIDPTTLHVAAWTKLPVGGEMDEFEAAFGSLWAVSFPEDALWRVSS
jgi:YVTN family beta-propeller protein